MSSDLYRIVNTFFIRLERGSELVSFLTELARRNGITHGAFTAFGALASARLAFFDRETRKYIQIANLESTQELISCIGSVTLRNGDPYAHAHAVVVDEKGTTRSGHLLEGKVIFTQVCLNQLEEQKD